jgi:hypothetical protein
MIKGVWRYLLVISSFMILLSVMGALVAKEYGIDGLVKLLMCPLLIGILIFFGIAFIALARGL